MNTLLNLHVPTSLYCIPSLILSWIADDFGSIVTPLSKIVAKDSNIVVVQLAIKCLGGIAKGLRKGRDSCLFIKIRLYEFNRFLAYFMLMHLLI